MTNTDLMLKSLGQLIYKLRKDKKMSQDELGKLTGTSQMTVKRLEAASVGTRIDNLAAISSALGVKLTDLFAEVEGRAKKTPAGTTQWDKVCREVNSLTLAEREWVATVVADLLQNPWKLEKN